MEGSATTDFMADIDAQPGDREFKTLNESHARLRPKVPSSRLVTTITKYKAKQLGLDYSSKQAPELLRHDGDGQTPSQPIKAMDRAVFHLHASELRATYLQDFPRLGLAHISLPSQAKDAQPLGRATRYVVRITKDIDTPGTTKGIA